MTDREMIEQMENDICNACKPRVAKCKGNFPCIMCGIVATELVEKYQPKIPDGAVVLSKEDYSDYLVLKNDYEHAIEKLKELQGDNERLYRNLGKFKDSVRKEMAREIFVELYNIRDYYGESREYEIRIGEEGLKELAKQCGVDLEE